MYRFISSGFFALTLASALFCMCFARLGDMATCFQMVVASAVFLFFGLMLKES